MTFEIGTIVVLVKNCHMGMVTGEVPDKKNEYRVDYFRKYSRTGPEMGTTTASEDELMYITAPELDSSELPLIKTEDQNQRYPTVKKIIQKFIPQILVALALRD